MRRRSRVRAVLLVIALAASVDVVLPDVAAADNCGTATDTCQGTFIGGAAAAVGAATLALGTAGTGRILRGRRGRPPQWERAEGQDDGSP